MVVSMKYKFIGKHFMFEKECNTTLDVQDTITRCSQLVDVRGQKVSKRITEVQGPDGGRIYPIR
jgi:hypothetical protein